MRAGRERPPGIGGERGRIRLTGRAGKASFVCTVASVAALSLGVLRRGWPWHTEDFFRAARYNDDRIPATARLPWFDDAPTRHSRLRRGPAVDRTGPGRRQNRLRPRRAAAPQGPL